MKTPHHFSLRTTAVCILQSAFCLSLLLLTGLSAQAATRDWTGGNGTGGFGDLNDAANWTGGLPTSLDTAQWNAGNYTTAPSATANQTIGQLLFGGNNTNGVTFGSGNATITLSRVNVIGIQLNAGSGAVNTGSANFITNDQRWINNSSSNLTVNGTINLNGTTLTMNGSSSGNFIVNGVIASSSTPNGSGLAKAGSDTLFLNGNNTYINNTFFSGGIINVATLSNYGVAGSLGNRASGNEGTGTNGIGLIFRGGTLQYTGSTAQSTDRQLAISANSSATIDASGTGNGTISFTRNGTNTSQWDNSTGNRTLTLTGSNTGNNTFAINIQAQGTSNQTSLVKSGNGTWVVTNANNSATINGTTGTNGGYGGGTTISGGTLGFANNALGGGVIDFTGNATLRWESGNTQDISSGTGGNVTRSLKIEDGITAKFDTGSNNVTLGTAITVGTLKTGGLTKTGTGNLTLSAANTYQGATTVSTGTLLINGSTSTNSTVTVASGATLGGNGTVGGFTTVNGDLKPGNSPGVLTFSSGLTLNGTTTMEINGATTPGTDFDQVVVSSGTTTFGGALAFTFGGPLLDNTDILLFNFAGTSLGNFSGVTSTGSYSGTWSTGVANNTWTFNTGTQLLTFSEVTGNLNVIPEPATWALLAFSLTTVMVLRRRYRRE